jgi:uncharacterized protein YbjT (DUF2867 family)
MTTNSKTIAVTGAAGNQGGAVARRMLAEGWRVRALTRDPAKPAAQALAAQGADLVAGNMDRPEELAAAFQGADAVFSIQNDRLPNVGVEGIVRQSHAVLDAAKAAGVRHYIFSSVGGANRGAGQKRFEVKYQVEQYVQASGLPFTILRPVSFMENLNWSRPDILSGTLPSVGVRPEKTLQMVAVQDIGGFTAVILAHPQDYLGRTVELAGDELTEAQIAETLARVIGRPVDEESIAFNRFLNGQGYTADIPALRRAYPDLLTLERYLSQNGWENAAPVPLPPGAAA